MHLKKNHSFMKKVILSCPENIPQGFKKWKIDFWYKVTFELVQPNFWYLFKPIMCKKGWCVGLGQEEVAWGWGNCLKQLKRGWNRKDTRRNRILKKGWQAGSRAGFHKKRGAGTPSQTMLHLNRLHKLYTILYVAHVSCFSSR